VNSYSSLVCAICHLFRGRIKAVVFCAMQVADRQAGGDGGWGCMTCADGR